MKTITWREIPILRLLPAFMLGIIFPAEFQMEIIIPVAFTFLLLLINIPHSPRTRVIVGSTILILTYLIASWVMQSTKSSQLLPEYAAIIGKVKTNKPTTKYENFTVQALLCKEENWTPCKATILLKIKKPATTFKTGSILTFNSRLKRLVHSESEQDFNYENYLLKKGIQYLSYPKTNEYTILETPTSPFFKIQDWRKNLISNFNKYIKSLNERSVLKSIILGDKTELPENLKNNYKKAGAMHILAVSGLHVGICYLLVSFLFKRLKTNNLYLKFGFVLAQISIIFFYVLMTGSSTSSIRASTMFALYLFGREFKLHQVSLNTLAGAAILILVFDPFSIYDVGFQFSFTALFGILMFYPVLKNLYIPNRRWKNHIWQITIIGICAQLGLLPILLFYTGEFPTYFILTGIAVMDLTFLTLLAGIIFLILELLFPLNGLGFLVLEKIGKLLNIFVEAVASLPYSSIKFGSIEPSWVIVFYIFYIILLIGVHNLSAKWIKLTIKLLIILSLINGIVSIFY